MNNKEYLNEEQFQKTNTKVNIASKIMLVIGGIMALVGIVLVITGFVGFSSDGSNKSFLSFGLGGFLLVFGFALLGLGGQAFLIGHRREITAYTTQQVMPVAKEGVEKMAPTAGVAAKEIAKGIKEGLEKDKK